MTQQTRNLLFSFFFNLLESRSLFASVFLKTRISALSGGQLLSTNCSDFTSANSSSRCFTNTHLLFQSCHHRLYPQTPSELWFQPQSALWPPERNSEEIVWRVDIKKKKNIEAVSSDCISADAFSSPLSLFQLSLSSSLTQFMYQSIHAKRKGCSIHTVTSAWGPSWGTVTTNCRCNTHAQTNTHTPSVPPCAPAQVFQPHTHVHTHALHPYLSSSSSMYPLLSWSRTVNTFLLSASDKPVSPTCSKNDSKLNVPGATLDHVHTHRHTHQTHIVERGRETDTWE